MLKYLENKITMEKIEPYQHALNRIIDIACALTFRSQSMFQAQNFNFCLIDHVLMEKIKLFLIVKGFYLPTKWQIHWHVKLRKATTVQTFYMAGNHHILSFTFTAWHSTRTDSVMNKRISREIDYIESKHPLELIVLISVHLFFTSRRY